jgi:hypothetical protein
MSNNTENLLLSQNVAYTADLALCLCPVQWPAHPQGAQWQPVNHDDCKYSIGHWRLKLGGVECPLLDLS